MKTHAFLGWLTSLLLPFHAGAAVAAEPIAPPVQSIRIAAAQAVGRVIDFRLKPDEAVTRMLGRLGGAAARHRMYLVVCSDCLESDGGTYNTAFLLGRDGKEIGWKQANALLGSGKPDEAIAAFQRLRREYPATWIDRRSEEQLTTLQPAAPKPDASAAGLAAKYPGDAGIAGDPDVLFADNFESGDMKKWDEQRRAVVAGDKPNSGRWCVQMTMERGKNHGGDAIKWFMPGADAVYARLYVKFSADYQYNHHFVWLGANQRTNKWSAFGKAGLKPDGTYYSTGMEPWFAWGKNPSPGEVNLYTYSLDMEPDPKMDKYWGNGFFPPGPGKGTAAGKDRVIPPLNQWQCWEFMIQANTAPDKTDGKQAMWVDGKLVGEFTGIRWRNDMDLKVNCFWLEHYGYDEGDPTKQYWKDSQSVWFDDVVVARRYIGPMKR